MLQTLDTHREFEELASEFLAAHPEISHDWRQIRGAWGGRTDLVCEPGSPREVFASLTDYQITVGADSGSTDFEDFGRGLSQREIAQEALSHFVSLLRERGLLASKSTP